MCSVLTDVVDAVINVGGAVFVCKPKRAVTHIVLRKRATLSAILTRLHLRAQVQTYLTHLALEPIRTLAFIALYQVNTSGSILTFVSEAIIVIDFTQEAAKPWFALTFESSAHCGAHAAVFTRISKASVDFALTPISIVTRLA